MKETRAVKFDLTEARMDDDSGTFEGYASLTNRYIPGFHEVVLPGAFTKTLSDTGGVVQILKNHRSTDWIGMGLEAREDHRGLKVRGQLAINDVQAATETWSLMKLSREVGKPAGLSIGFRAVDGNDTGSFKGKKDVRLLKEVSLMEYSITPFPASSGARVTKVRSIAQAMSELDEREIALLSAALRTDEAASSTVDEPDLHSLLKQVERLRSIAGG